MAKYLKMPAKQICITVSELNQEILTAEEARGMIRECSYQVISGCLEAYAHYQTTEILLALLPLSSNRLIDVCLPFFASGAPLLARYILIDNKLRGIRVCSSGSASGEWPISRCQRCPPPTEVQRYYRDNAIAYLEDEVYVGVFCLQFVRCRIGLLFVSQIIENGALLDIPSKYQYDIVSVTNDLSKRSQDISDNYRQREALSKLKKLGEEELITVVHAGLRIVPSLSKYYDSKTFIAQERVQTQGRKHLGEPAEVTFLCSVDLTLSKRLQFHCDSEETIINESEVIEGLYINRSLKYFQRIFGEGGSSADANKVHFNENLEVGELRLMNLWYIYKTVNFGSPFVLPYPFTPRCRQLYFELIKLERYALISNEELIKIYRYKAGENQQMNLQLRVYSDIDQMIESNSELFPDLIYVYTNDEAEIKALRNNPKYCSRICYCDHLNPYVEQPDPQSLSSLQKRKIEQACNHVIRERLKTVDQIFAHFREMDFSRAEIEHCFIEELPKRIKRGIKPMSIYYFLLHSPKEKIIKEIGESQLRYGNYAKQKSNDEGNDKNFRQRLQKTKAYKKKVTNYVECHRCQLSLSKSMAYLCTRCDEWLCYGCLDILTSNTLTNLDSYKCVLCSRLCHCRKCYGQRPERPKLIEQYRQIPQIAQGISPGEFACHICQIMGENYKQITLECSQCKKICCFICQKNRKGDGYKQSQMTICKDCEEFNNSRSGVILNARMNPSETHINVDERTQQLQRADAASKQIEPIKVNCPQEKISRQQNLANVIQSQSLEKKKYTLERKPQRSRSSSSSRSPRKKRQKSGSRSRSRSKDRHHKQEKKDHRRVEQSKSRQKQFDLERKTSKNSQKDLWGGASERSSQKSPSKDINHHSRGNNWQPRGKLQENDKRNYQGNNSRGGQYNYNNNRSQDNSKFNNFQHNNGSSKNKNLQGEKINSSNNLTGILIPPVEEIDYEQISY